MKLTLNNDKLVFSGGEFYIANYGASENFIILEGWFAFEDGREEEGAIEFEFNEELSVFEFFKKLFNNELKKVKATFSILDGGWKKFEEGFYELATQ